MCICITGFKKQLGRREKHGFLTEEIIYKEKNTIENKRCFSFKKLNKENLVYQMIKIKGKILYIKY